MALLVFLGVFCSVFVTVLSFVCMYKVVQIAEDLRYQRSKSDTKVERPKRAFDTVVKVAVVSGIVAIFVAALVAGAVDVAKLGSAVQRPF